MVIPPEGNVRIIRSALRADAAARALAAEVAQPEWVRGARVIKQDERTSVMSGEASVDGVRRGVIVKCMRADRPKDILSRLLGRTRLAMCRRWCSLTTGDSATAAGTLSSHGLPRRVSESSRGISGGMVGPHWD